MSQRVCSSCGTVQTFTSGAPCLACGASPYHLRPVPKKREG